MDNKKMQAVIAPLSVACLLMSCLMVCLSYTKSEEKVVASDLPQMVKSPVLKSSFDFAGENVPMNIDTRERLERDLLTNSYYHTSTVLAIKNAPRYFPVIERILAEQGVPDDFKYLCVAESNMSNVTSPAGAKGYWQFMKAAAADYGLVVNVEIEERFHLEKSTIAACKYIKALKNTTGSWTGAAAAYNMGLANLNKTMAAQGQSSYYDMNLNEETSRYLFRIIALKEILSNPRAFGYYIDEDQKYQPLSDVKELVLTESIPNLGDFARKNGISYRIFKYYNPWLIDTKLTVAPGKTYTVKLPIN